MNRALSFLMVFALSIISCACVHEVGHSVAGLAQGVPVVPTPFKEYVLHRQIEWRQQSAISLGGVVGTVLFIVATITWYIRKDKIYGDAMLAGALITPCAYTLRFLLVGRGHDGLEWQAAQSALGVNASGHTLDVLFLMLSLAGIAVLIIRRRHSLSLALLMKAAGLMVVGFMLLVVFQVWNNKLFDRFFVETQIVNLPSGLESE